MPQVDTDFRYQVNHEGEWCDALLSESNDGNNKSFIYYVSGTGFINTDGFIPRGTDSGHWRDKQ